MSHLTIGSNISSVLKMDDGMLGTGAPIPRWQRKAREQGIGLLPSSNSNENSFANGSGSCIITPHKTPLTANSFLLDSSLSAVGGATKSPGRGPDGISTKRGKSPGRVLKLSVRQRTPSRNTPNTPNLLGDKSYCGDRFIPMRPTELEFERSHHMLMKHMHGKEEEEEELTQQQRDHRERLSENLNDGQPLDQRVVHFSRKAPQTCSNAKNQQKVLFSANKASSSKTNSTRHIPNTPERVLDAPELKDDYYLHLIDWSKHNHVVVALAGCIYVWNANDGNISPLTNIDEPDYFCSLKWTKDGNVLSVGMSDGGVELWDIEKERRIRTMDGHEGRVVTLAWNATNLTSGSRAGQIIHHDIRVAQHVAAVVNAHNQEVCGLAWNDDNRLLASGGNDNMVKIWDARNPVPLQALAAHQAAIKAVSWCPWQQNLLSTGGGTADRKIKLWNSNTGSCIKEILTNSQVAAIVWNPSYKEIITGHGFTDNQLTIWKYPNFTKVTELTGHTGRVLDIVMSPDTQLVASAAADETIRLWKVWPTLAKEKKPVRTLHTVSSISRALR